MMSKYNFLKPNSSPRHVSTLSPSSVAGWPTDPDPGFSSELLRKNTVGPKTAGAFRLKREAGLAGCTLIHLRLLRRVWKQSSNSECRRENVENFYPSQKATDPQNWVEMPQHPSWCSREKPPCVLLFTLDPICHASVSPHFGTAGEAAFTARTSSSSPEICSSITFSSEVWKKKKNPLKALEFLMCNYSAVVQRIWQNTLLQRRHERSFTLTTTLSKSSAGLHVKICSRKKGALQAGERLLIIYNI